MLLVIATCFLPFAILIDRADNHVDWEFPWNSWLVYVIIVNTTFLMIGGAYIFSTVAYPYSNSIMVRNLAVKTNKKFGLEFARCIDRMTRMIQEIQSSQHAENVSAIIEGRDDDNKSSSYYLSEKDVYMRIAQNLELIELYLSVNRLIINQNPNQNALFIRTTDCLRQLKSTLELI